MSTDLYSRVQEMILDKIEDYGTDLTVRVTTRGTFNPTTDFYAASDTDYDTKGLLVKSKRAVRDESDRLILVETKEMLVPASNLPDLEQAESISLIQGARTWSVIGGIETVKPGDTILLYRIRVK